MARTSYPLKLPHSLKQEAQRLAKNDGVSLNQFIAAAVAEKVGTLNTVNAFLEVKSGQAVPADMLAFLDAAPDVEPMPGDELPN